MFPTKTLCLLRLLFITSIIGNLSLPSCGSPVGKETHMSTPSTTSITTTSRSLLMINRTISSCPDSSSDTFQWPKPSQLANRQRRSKLQKMMAENDYAQIWDPNDPVSNSRWRPIIDLLPDSIRTAILNLTRPNQITISDLRLLDVNAVAMFHKELSRLLTQDQVLNMTKSLLQRQKYRQAAQIMERLSILVKNPDMIINLWNDQKINSYQRCSNDIQAFLRQSLRLLPSPAKWNKTVVKNYGLGFISALPPDVLIQIHDSEAASTILDLWMSDDSFGCGFPSGSGAVDSVISASLVQVKLLIVALGDDVKKWSITNLSRYPSLLPKLSPRLLTLIDDQVLVDSITFLSQIKDWKDGQGYVIVQRLLASNATDLVNATSDRLTFLIDRFNFLGPYVLPEFLTNTSSQQASLSVWANKIDNFSQRAMTIPQLTASALLQYRLAGMTATMNPQNLSQQLDPNYLKVAPWKLWKLNLNQSDLTSSVINKGLLQRLAVDRSSGSLTDGQIKRLSFIATRLFRRGDYWNMANTPAIYWSGANLSDYSSVPSKEIQSVMDMVTRMADKMNGGQLAIIYTKLRNDNVDLSGSDSAQVIKAMAPVPYLKLQYTPDQLASLATDMPSDSIIRLMYAAAKLKENITIDDLNHQPLLAAHMSPSRLDDFALSETPALFEALSSSSPGLTVQTVRALEIRLRNFTRINRVDVANNDVGVLENVWLSNLDIYPATVLSAFSYEALQTVSPLKKIELLRSLGRLSWIDYYTIPRNKRENILEQGLVALGKSTSGDINEENLAYIGNAVLDLDSNLIARLTPRAFESVLHIFQGDVDIFGGLSARPCLNSKQRSAIRRALKAVYGHPSSWGFGTVMATCCSLDTLTSAELEAIRDDYFLVGCKVCNADIQQPIHLQVLSQTLKTACLFELGTTQVENGLHAGIDLVAKRRAQAAFKTHRGGKVIVRGINQDFVDENKLKLTCEAVIASGSGAGFTAEQLVTLSRDDIRDCLYELGSRPLSWDKSALLWNKVIEVYGLANKIPKDQLIQLGWILDGASTTSLNLLRVDDSDLVASLGSIDRQISFEKLQVLSNNVISEWKQGPKFYTGQDLMTLGRLLCGMNASSVARIPSASYLEASAYLGMILFQPRCSYDVLVALASKAVDNSVFGSPSNWTAAIVRNVGVVIGGLSPEQLRLLPPDSLLGLTPDAVVSISTNNFQAFKTQQIRNFPLAAAQAVTADQRWALVTEMTNALDYVIYGDSLGSSSNFVLGSRELVVFIVGTTMFLKHVLTI